MSRLLIISASTRPKRRGRAIADWAVGQAEAHGAFKVALADLAEINLPFLDEPEEPTERAYVHEHTKNWSATVDAADAFVFVLPEYNNSFTAPLKNALDFLYYEWHYKPVGFISYANASAGLRAAQGIRPAVTALRMVPVPENVAIHYVGRTIGEDGVFNPTEAMAGSATALFDELARLAPVLAPLRENQS